MSNSMEIEITNKEFNLLKSYVYDHTGINLSDQKVNLLKTRLNKRLRALKLNTFKEYYEFLIKNEAEYEDFVNAISTNVTSFFREPRQWEFLKKEINNIQAKNGGKLRIWSSASSTGEEPYTIGIFLKEELKNFENANIKILATDISHDALTKAIKGVFSQKSIAGLERQFVLKNFTRVDKSDSYRINEDIKKLILFREFNLVYGNYSLFKEGTFDIVFCRNVMIYFDNETKNRIIHNLVRTLKKGGYILLGHSENLMNYKGVEYVMPTVYRKI